MPRALDPQEWKAVELKNSKFKIKELVRIPKPHVFDSPITIATFILSWSLWASYLTMQYRCLPPIRQAAVGYNLLPVLCLLLEIFALLPTFLNAVSQAIYIFCGTFLGTKGKHRASYRLVGEAAPYIDVCITSCGEKLDIIMDTISGAAMQDYPAESFQVFVLDDAKSDELKKEIDAYNEKYSKNVRYLARTKLPNESSFYKAGNLRFGLTVTADMGKNSEFFASLDVDNIPEPDWLRQMIPHLILDKNLALANPGSWSYNLPDVDWLGQAGPATLEIFEPMSDSIGCAHCFGSGYIVRRRALDDIGGWPKVPVGEDIFCSYMLAGYGWGIAFVKEIVQYSLTADSFDILLAQRRRWVDGDVLLAKGINFLVPALDPGPRRTVPQRSFAILKIIKLVTPFTDCAYIFLLPIIIWRITSATDKATIGDNTIGLKALFLATILADKLNTAMIYASVGRQSESRFWSAPYVAARLIYNFHPATVVSFIATGTVISNANERSARHRQRLARRLLTPTILMYSIYTFLASLPLLSFLYLSLRSQWEQRPTGQLPYMCTGAVVRLLECVYKVSVPPRYMIIPPTVPPRRELMQQDELGVFRPKEKHRYKIVPGRMFTFLDILEVAIVLLIDGQVLWAAL